MPKMLGLDVGVAGGGRRGVRAVAVVVAGRVELVGVGADEGAVGVGIIWRAPISLLLQVNGASFGLCAGVAEVAGRITAVRPTGVDGAG